MTLERTGRSMKNFEIMAGSYLADAGGCFDLLQLRIDLLAGDRAQQPGDHDAVVRLQAAFDHAQPAVELPDLHLALLDHVVAVHDQHVAAGLVAAERGVGDEQRVLAAGRRARGRGRNSRAAARGRRLGNTPRTASVPVD